MTTTITAEEIPGTIDGIRMASQALYTPGLGEKELARDIESVLTYQILNQPRSQQKIIGPSEIGTDCEHCLAAKLAGWEQSEKGIAWAPTIGTAVHALFEEFFHRNQLRIIGQNPDQPVSMEAHRYWWEQKTMVGKIGDQEIWGSTDLIDLTVGATVDWKLVGKSVLDNYRRKGPTPQYRVQAHLYAKGWNDAGVKVDHVSIAFLPRTTIKFSDRYWWSEPYNEQIAVDALAKANQIHTNLKALEAISVEVRDNWISSLPRADHCRDCERFQQDWTPNAKPQVTNGVDMTLPTK
ncbi:hypothetical protein FYJ24_09520 [Actinomycetaceae bacterium WB03_NA08]|uniref:Uncharacterized protein n=1 Tax=Scrofimicrobium canadense TaxID=2652290 RepID=A0A6N7WA22_9ACTO|nr:hypothetical protein [Scrofimicrobium canadense]MSS84998.1 hypothetical protein [Scrofimicrobium canadense]